jgi:hypothetical protein
MLAFESRYARSSRTAHVNNVRSRFVTFTAHHASLLATAPLPVVTGSFDWFILLYIVRKYMLSP